MFNILKSYWLRSKRMPVRKVLFMCPLLYSLAFSTYITLTSNLKGMEMAYYFLAYIILACFSVSFFIPMLYESDKNAGMYANDLSCGIGRKKLFFSRFIFILLLLMLIEIIAVLSFLAFLYFYGVEIHLLGLAISFLICLLSLMPMLPLYQFLTLKFNYSGSIIVGAIFTLAGILLGTTNLGEGIWYVLPFVYPIKFLFGYLDKTFTLSDIFSLLILCIFLSIMSLIMFSLWYNKWDGASELEE